MSGPHHSLAVCADDFGQSLPLSKTVTRLAAMGRLTAVSCLTSGAEWGESARLLATFPGAVLRGLHFNLTLGTPLSPDLRVHWPEFPSLPVLLLQAGVRALPLQAISKEWRAQWEAFVDSVGQVPDFIDGHQHVHHLPGVRDLILSQLPPGVAVRSTGCLLGPGFAFKRAVIAVTGGRRLARLLEQMGRAHNQALVGVYDFRESDYRMLMQRWLRRLPPQGALLFCHPGAGNDSIAPARVREALYLGSSAFLDDLDNACVSLGHAWPRNSSAC